jgi:hypothetical protein
MPVIASWSKGTPQKWINYIEESVSVTGGYVDGTTVATWGINPNRDVLWLPRGLPACQFHNKQVRDVVRMVNGILKAHHDVRRATHWWFSPNTNLRRIPAQLLGRNQDTQLLEAARMFR